ncbi:hypothetical protein TWF694_000795 [Orbilia ellipsospora]|uniref:Uncharacterized protein n=1 Tax=Orbilia ellipsospora TaxID=2528407 RepID=A0AAV9XQ22_9PEZI
MVFLSGKRKCFLEQNKFPSAGSFVWVKIPDIGYGRRPTSQTSFSLSTSTTKSSLPKDPKPLTLDGKLNHSSPKYHLALIKGVSWLRSGINVIVYPCVTFAKYRVLAPPQQILHARGLSDLSRNFLLPLPHLLPDTSSQKGYRAAETPPPFGQPLDCGDWATYEATWLYCGAVAFDMNWDEPVSILLS